MISPIWVDGNRIKIIAQTLLPEEYQVKELHSVKEMFDAIRILEVRGAPALGVASALGIYLGVKEEKFQDRQGFIDAVEKSADYICGARPTAYNLFWAADRVRKMATEYVFVDAEAARDAVLDEAKRILEEDLACCHSIGLYGAELLKDADCFLTHCNAGALATSGGYGTALAPIYVLHEQGKQISVYSDETRPLLQGSRLTVWELMQSGIPVTAICDNMAGLVLKSGKIDAVIVGADRIAANGDSANKIGTYSLSILAKAHGVPFYIAAPFSTVDFSISKGDEIPIEQRSADEVRHFGDRLTAPQDAKVFNPAFDVAPHENITAIITEKGIAYAPFAESLRKLEKEGSLRVQKKVEGEVLL